MFNSPQHRFAALILASLSAIWVAAEEPVGSNSTGFFVSSAGHILTQSNSESITVGYNDRNYTAELISREPGTGLTLLKINAKNTPFLPLAKQPKMELGDRIFSIGFPDIIKSRSPRYSKGVIHSLVGNDNDQRHLEVDASLSLGNNGAAVINSSNQVVGILSIQKGVPTIGYKAIKSALAYKLIKLIPESHLSKPSPSTNIARVRQATVALSHRPTIAKESAQIKPEIVKAVPIDQSKLITQVVERVAPLLTLEQQIDRFVSHYFQAVSKGDIDKLSTMLSPKKSDLYELHQSYIKYWPVRKFQITNSHVQEAFFDQIEAVVEYQFKRIDKQGETSEGSATNYFTIENRESGFRILTSQHVCHEDSATNTSAKVEGIISQYMIQGSTDGQGASYLFADSIHYYGSRKSRAQAEIDEANYNSAWPKRYYKPAKKHEIKPIENGRYYANAYSIIGASNGRTHRIIDTVSSFIINPTNGSKHSIEKVWLASTKERKVSETEFAAFCRQCSGH